MSETRTTWNEPASHNSCHLLTPLPDRRRTTGKARSQCELGELMKQLTMAPFLRGLRGHVATLDALAKWENGDLTGEVLNMSPAHMQVWYDVSARPATATTYIVSLTLSLYLSFTPTPPLSRSPSRHIPAQSAMVFLRSEIERLQEQIEHLKHGITPVLPRTT